MVGLSGKRVPPALAIVPASLVSVMVTSAGLQIVSGFVALAVRGGAGIVDSLLRVAGVLPRGLTGLTYQQILGQSDPSAYTLWSGAAIDAYFLIGGILFGLAARRYRRQSRNRQEIRLVAEGLTTTKRKH
jgi:hypothetical protein